MLRVDFRFMRFVCGIGDWESEDPFVRIAIYHWDSYDGLGDTDLPAKGWGIGVCSWCFYIGRVLPGNSLGE